MTTTTKLFTLAEYLTYDHGSDRRYELVNGELKEMPSESDLNNAIAIFLLLAFAKFVPGSLLRRGTEIVVSGSRATVRVPDLLILTEELVTALSETTRSIITPDMSPPALVIEVVWFPQVKKTRIEIIAISDAARLSEGVPQGHNISFRAWGFPA